MTAVVSHKSLANRIVFREKEIGMKILSPEEIAKIQEETHTEALLKGKIVRDPVEAVLAKQAEVTAVEIFEELETDCNHNKTDKEIGSMCDNCNQLTGHGKKCRNYIDCAKAYTKIRECDSCMQALKDKYLGKESEAALHKETEKPGLCKCRRFLERKESNRYE